MHMVFKIASLLTIALGLLIAFAGPISQIGIFDWRTAFKIILNGAPFLMGGAAFSLIGLIYALVTKTSGQIIPSLLAITIVGGVIFSLDNMRATGGKHPIHDITTDMDNPPAIVAGAQYDRDNPAEYVGDKPLNDGTTVTVRETQQRLYPDLAPQTFSQSQDIVFKAATASVNAQGWEILSSDNVTGIIEATHTSRWFGFIDDVIIRIQPVENGTRVDIRSKSRVGRSDLGANVTRIRLFQVDLQTRL